MKTSSNLVLLHGALGAASQFGALKTALENDHSVSVLNFSGHGGKPFAPGFSIETFAQELLAFFDQNNIEKADVFGYSMGGYVALQLARTAQERIGKIITLATKFDWTPEIAAREVKMLDPEKIEEKVPAFAEMLALRHAPNDWKEVLRKTAGLMLALGGRNLLDVNVLSKIPHPALICLGDSDQMISMEETRRAAEALPNGKLLIFDQTPHPFEKVDVEKLAAAIRDFLKES
jgi:pimeloyl-ACP methyl ester carboxylesterase